MQLERPAAGNIVRSEIFSAMLTKRSPSEKSPPLLNFQPLEVEKSRLIPMIPTFGKNWNGARQ
jgi:hypothetical protein